MEREGMRVLVCGSRDFDDYDFVWNKIHELDSRLGPFTTLIHGYASGVDSQAAIVAGTLKDCKIIGYRAEWRRYGKRAGPIRNQRMLDEGKPDLVIAFPGGRGTADMKQRARRAGIEVLEIGNPLP